MTGQGRRQELNPGEFFLVADRMILVHEYESILANISKIGVPGDRLAYLLTFSGKLNNLDLEESVTVALPPEDAWELVGQILNGLELLSSAVKESKEKKDAASRKEHLRGCQSLQGIGLPCNCDEPGSADGIAGDTGCKICGRDNRNGTHTALEMTGHLNHEYLPLDEKEN